MTKRNFIRHVVFFSAKDPKDIPTIVAGLWKLADIPHSTTFEICENTRVDALSGDVDVVVYAEFPDAEALAADALSHRMVPAWQAISEGRSGRSLVADILREVRPW